MEINVDFSFFPDNLMHIITSSLEIKSSFCRVFKVISPSMATAKKSSTQPFP